MATFPVSGAFSGTGSLAGTIERVKGISGTFSGTGNLELDTDAIQYVRAITGFFDGLENTLELNPDNFLILRSQVWWDKSYTYRRILQIQPNVEGFEVDHPLYAVLGKDLIRQRKVRTDAQDIEVLRLVSFVPETWQVVPKQVEILDTSILVHWPNEVEVEPDTIVKDLYYIYYGNQDLVNQPEEMDDYEPTVWPVSLPYDSSRLSYTRPGEHWEGDLALENGAKVTLEFYGPRVRILSDIGPGYGIAEVQIDDEDWQQVDLYNPAYLAEQEIFVRENLSLDYHHIRFRRSGFKAASATDYVINLQKIEYLRHNIVVNVMEEADETLMWGSVIGGVVGK